MANYTLLPMAPSSFDEERSEFRLFSSCPDVVKLRLGIGDNDSDVASVDIDFNAKTREHANLRRSLNGRHTALLAISSGIGPYIIRHHTSRYLSTIRSACRYWSFRE